MKHLTFLLSLLILDTAFVSAEPTPLPLWPEGVPEQAGFSIPAEATEKKADGIARVSNVSLPSLTVYRPEKATGTCVLICPGGGYNILAIEHEGTQVADYLNTLGVTGAVLKYRVPRRDKDNPHLAPLQDAQRALGILKSRAAEFGIKPDRIGVLGFSAGGNLTVMAGLHANERTFPLDAKVDLPDVKPAFIVPVYPAYLVTDDKAPFMLKPEIAISPQSPPALLIHASDDRLSATASALVYLEYKRHNVPAELHLYAQGGHGFGMKTGPLPANSWHLRLGEWLGAMGSLKP
jgi:acetyl esterase/lipase